MKWIQCPMFKTSIGDFSTSFLYSGLVPAPLVTIWKAGATSRSIIFNKIPLAKIIEGNVAYLYINDIIVLKLFVRIYDTFIFDAENGCH